jgi:hypothetical protein
MINLKILEESGCHERSVRELITSKEGKYAEAREKMEREINSRISEGVEYAIDNHALYTAIDMAMDASPVNKQTIPLMLYAQGKIDLEAISATLGQLGCSEKFVQKDGDGKVIGVDVPNFFELSINLVRSVISRRHAALATRYSNLWPYYVYESRGTDLPEKLRADVLSQRVEVIIDQYGHRHHDSQCIRDALTYGHTVDFIRDKWEKEKQWVDSGRKTLESRIEPIARVMREGLVFVNPHPTRVFWDNAHPLASINTDTGCSYIGFWDVMRFGDLKAMPIQNRERIFNASWFSELVTKYHGYFDNNCPTAILRKGARAPGVDKNDRKNNVGLYSDEHVDAPVVVANYFKKLVPRDYCLGDYPYEVWFRHMVAGDGTVVYMSPLPSRPAAYLGLDENDNRQVNVSQAHLVAPFQDQLTMLASQMLMLLQADLLKVVGINTDVLSDPSHITYIRNHFKGFGTSSRPLIVEFSVTKMKELGVDVQAAFNISQTSAHQQVTVIFDAMLKLVGLMERLLGLSPAEMGQPAPREISAREVSEISSSSSNTYTFFSDSVDDFRAAKKLIISESLIQCAEPDFVVPVIGRYPKKVIDSAGFAPSGTPYESGSEVYFTSVAGSIQQLNSSYIYTSRDGAERPSSVQNATALAQMIGQMGGIPPQIIQNIPVEKWYEMLNELFRNMTGVDLKLDPAESDAATTPMMQELSIMIQQLAANQEALSSKIQSMEAGNTNTP